MAVNGVPTALHVGSFVFFRSETLEFYWRDPEPSPDDPIRVPTPGAEWRYYFECVLGLVDPPEFGAIASEREKADVEVTIHPKIHPLLMEGNFAAAHVLAQELREVFKEEGYKPDGIRVVAGDEWRAIRFE